MKIVLRHIRKHFFTRGTDKEIFSGLHLDLNQGEFTVILGPNGSGKSTLLNLISGLDKNFEGEITFTNSPTENTPIAYMMQRDYLLPWRTVRNNVILGREIGQRPPTTLTTGDYAFLKYLNLEQLWDRYPAGLSGGERQRVALARTLLVTPDTLLLDEPFSAIEYNSRVLLQVTLYSWVKQLGRTAVMVTHDIDEAITMADRILILGPKPAGIIDDFRIGLDATTRHPMTIRAHPQFADYYSRIWSAMSLKK